MNSTELAACIEAFMVTVISLGSVWVGALALAGFFG